MKSCVYFAEPKKDQSHYTNVEMICCGSSKSTITDNYVNYVTRLSVLAKLERQIVLLSIIDEFSTNCCKSWLSGVHIH
jgi:hypothetical protein